MCLFYVKKSLNKGCCNETDLKWFTDTVELFVFNPYISYGYHVTHDEGLHIYIYEWSASKVIVTDLVLVTNVQYDFP